MKTPHNKGKFISLDGQRFGRLEVVKTYQQPYRGGNATWCDCDCACGGTVTTRAASLKSGAATSCGCFRSGTARILKWERLTQCQKEGELKLSLPPAMQHLIGLPGVRFIPLTQGLFTAVDELAYDGLRLLRWHARKSNGTFYAVRSHPETNLSQGLHAYLFGYHDGRMVDHKNGCGLDNRRENLRLADKFQNAMNRAAFGKTSKFKGVYFNKGNQSWMARIMKDGKRVHLGNFKSEADAARAYSTAETKLFGEYASSNRVPELAAILNEA